MRRENFRNYPNFYSSLILQLAEYKIIGIEEIKGKTTLQLRNPEGNPKLYSVSLYMEKTSEGAKLMAEDAIKTLESYLNSDKCKYSQETKDSLQSVVNSQQGEMLNQNILSGGYSHIIERTFQKINSKKDYGFEEVRIGAVTGLATSIDAWTTQNSEFGNRFEAVQVGKYVSDCYNTVLKGHDLAATMQIDDSSVLLRAN